MTRPTSSASSAILRSRLAGSTSRAARPRALAENDEDRQEGRGRPHPVRAAQGIGKSVVTGDYADAALRETLRSRAADRAMNAAARAVRRDRSSRPAAAASRAAAALPQRVPARPRPHHPFHRVPPPRSTRPRCSSITRATCSAPGSRIRSKWRRSRAPSRAPCASTKT